MESIWEEFKENLNLKRLNKNIEVDICIVGLGLTAINTAYFLIKQGYKVAIIEGGEYANNTSSKSTAKITSQHQLKYAKLINKKGVEYTKKYFSMQENAIKYYKYIIEKEKIDCDFEEKSSYVIAETQKDKTKLQEEFRAYKKINANVKFHRKLNIPIAHIAALELRKQAQFNPVKYMNNLIKIIKKNKGKIYIKSRVEKIENCISYYRIRTKENYIKSKYVIVATNYPIIKIKGAYFSKLYQSTSYAISFEVEKDELKGIYINSGNPVYSYRTAKNKKGNLCMILVGFSHKTGKNIYVNNNFEELISKAKQIYPNIKIYKKWTTEDSVSIDKVPYIGKVCLLNKNFFVATGYSKWGVTNSMIAAKIIERKILNFNKENDNIFKSTRYRYLENKKEFASIVKDAINNMLLEKMGLRNYSIKKIKKGESKTLKRNGEIIGIYKDETGKMYAVNPICSHLNCLLKFNYLEKTWDCPCHGSKYNYDGKIIYGPGTKNLKQIKIK